MNKLGSKQKKDLYKNKQYQKNLQELYKDILYLENIQGDINYISPELY